MLDANQLVEEFFYLESMTSDPEMKSAGPYTNPALRNRLKNQIMAGSQGGRPGQWSARKAQLLAMRYRKAGGRYKKGKKPTKAQRSLRKWTRERWRTSDGKPALRNGRMRRYLPDKVWGRLTPAQRAATNRKKIQGDRQGRQFVANTETAARTSKRVRSRTKSLGPTIGSRGGTGSGVPGLAAFDGDGDGFVTGPDGKDNIPSPLKIAADAVAHLDGTKRLQAAIDFVRKLDEDGKQSESVLSITRAFNLEQYTFRRYLGQLVPNYLENHKAYIKKIREQQRQYIIENDHKPLWQLSRETGLSEERISRIRRQAGLPPRRAFVARNDLRLRGRRVTQAEMDAEIQRVAELTAQGFPSNTIVQMLGLPGQTVRRFQRIARERGMSIDPPQDNSERILNFALGGFSAIQISQRLGVPLDEIFKVIEDAGGLEGFIRGDDPNITYAGRVMPNRVKQERFFFDEKGLGRSVRNIVRRVKPSEYDGDGDGFMVGPDGQDNVPVAARFIGRSSRNRGATPRPQGQDATPAQPTRQVSERSRIPGVEARNTGFRYNDGSKPRWQPLSETLSLEEERGNPIPEALSEFPPDKFEAMWVTHRPEAAMRYGAQDAGEFDESAVQQEDVDVVDIDLSDAILVADDGDGGYLYVRPKKQVTQPEPVEAQREPQVAVSAKEKAQEILDVVGERQIPFKPRESDAVSETEEERTSRLIDAQFEVDPLDSEIAKVDERLRELEYQIDAVDGAPWTVYGGLTGKKLKEDILKRLQNEFTALRQAKRKLQDDKYYARQRLEGNQGLEFTISTDANDLQYSLFDEVNPLTSNIPVSEVHENDEELQQLNKYISQLIKAGQNRNPVFPQKIMLSEDETKQLLSLLAQREKRMQELDSDQPPSGGFWDSIEESKRKILSTGAGQIYAAHAGMSVAVDTFSGRDPQDGLLKAILVAQIAEDMRKLGITEEMAKEVSELLGPPNSTVAKELHGAMVQNKVLNGGNDPSWVLALANVMISNWAATSNDHAVPSLVSQLVARDLMPQLNGNEQPFARHEDFMGLLSGASEQSAQVIAEALKLSKNPVVRAAFEAMLKSQWARTQEQLSLRGFDTVEVYRGLDHAGIRQQFDSDAKMELTPNIQATVAARRKVKRAEDDLRRAIEAVARTDDESSRQRLKAAVVEVEKALNELAKLIPAALPDAKQQGRRPDEARPAPSKLVVELQNLPLASTASLFDESLKFGNDEKIGVKVKGQVPASAVMSTTCTGFGCHNETELVIAHPLWQVSEASRPPLAKDEALQSLDISRITSNLLAQLPQQTIAEEQISRRLREELRELLFEMAWLQQQFIQQFEAL